MAAAMKRFEAEVMNAEVRVFCPECKNGVNAIWFGSLIDWGVELSKTKPPAWAQYCANHERAHGHKIMMKYSDKTVPLGLATLEVHR